MRICPSRLIGSAALRGCLAIFLSGCAGTLRLDSAPAYRPDLKGISLPEPFRAEPPRLAGRTPGAGSRPAVPTATTAPVAPPIHTPAVAVTPTPPVNPPPAQTEDLAAAPPSLPLPAERASPADDARAATASGTVRRLTTGDSLVIHLYTREETHYEEVIDERGNVTLPYINAVRIAGLTSAEAEDLIKTRYIKEGIFRENLSVMVIAEARNFYIRGYVMRTGGSPLRPGMRLTQAIGSAGGPNEFGDEKRIKILRGESGVTEEHNLEKIKDGKAPDPEIRPGDIIEVPQRRF